MGDTKPTDEGNQEATNDVFDEAFSKAEVEDITPKMDEKKEEEAAASIPEKPEKPEQKDGESDEAYEQRWRTLQGIYRHEKDEWKERENKLVAELEEVKKQIPQSAENKEEGDSGLKDLLAKLNLTDDQKAQLQEYDQEFDIVSKMEGLKREQAIAKLKSEMLETMNGFKKEFQAQLEPAANLVKETAVNREEAAKNAHFQYIREKHSDFEEHRDSGAILQWIETKPKYLQKAMKESYSQGTAEDIVELLDGFKEENNIAKGKVIPFNKAKEERKQALTPPTTRRGAVNASMSAAADFEGAFDEALNRNQ